jgi:hypothetical protein
MQISEESYRAVSLWTKLKDFEITIKHKARVEIRAADVVSRSFADAAIEKNPTCKLIWNTHKVLDQRSSKVVLEYLKEERLWPGLRQKIWRTIVG